MAPRKTSTKKPASDPAAAAPAPVADVAPVSAAVPDLYIGTEPAAEDHAGLDELLLPSPPPPSPLGAVTEKDINDFIEGVPDEVAPAEPRGGGGGGAKPSKSRVAAAREICAYDDDEEDDEDLDNIYG